MVGGKVRGVVGRYMVAMVGLMTVVAMVTVVAVVAKVSNGTRGQKGKLFRRMDQFHQIKGRGQRVVMAGNSTLIL